jgi:hypothetical protein
LLPFNQDYRYNPSGERALQKVYDKPKTPYQSMLESEDVSDEVKAELKKRAVSYNPVALKIAIDKMRDRLLRITGEKVKGLNASGQEVSARKIIRQCACLTPPGFGDNNTLDDPQEFCGL